MSLLSHNIDAFLAVADKQSVHLAAAVLGIGQTAVTQRLRALEKEMGITLFTRSRKGMQLTAEGQILYRHASKIRQMEGELAANLKGENQKIKIVITGPSSIMRTRVIPILPKLMKEYPFIAATLNIDDDDQGLDALKTGKADFALLPRSQVVDELDSKLLRSERYQLVGSKKWKGRSLAEIVEEESIVDFNPADTHTYNFLKKYRLLSKARKERHFVNNTDGLAALVTEGGGYTVLSEDFIDVMPNGEKLINLADGRALEVEFALAWYPRHELSPYLKDLIQLIK